MGNSASDFEERPDDHKSPFKQGDSIEDMGHCITIGLSRNNKNWILFNLASLYWRIEGNAYEVRGRLVVETQLLSVQSNVIWFLIHD